MGEAFPELAKAQPVVQQALQIEEERFADTLDNGLKILDHAIEEMGDKEIPGETIFLLYDTYGFPIDLTADIARERGLTIDVAGFERHMEAQRNRARSASQFGGALSETLIIDGETIFCGYDHMRNEGVMAKMLINCMLVTKALSFWITHRFMLNPVVRSVIRVKSTRQVPTSLSKTLANRVKPLPTSVSVKTVLLKSASRSLPMLTNITARQRH